MTAENEGEDMYQQTQISRLEDELRVLEWAAVTHQYGATCPLCGNSRRNDHGGGNWTLGTHATDCVWVDALEWLNEDGNPKPDDLRLYQLRDAIEAAHLTINDGEET
jgi:hypothetical protein